MGLNLQPYNDWMLLEKVDIKTSSLVIPDSVKEKREIDLFKVVKANDHWYEADRKVISTLQVGDYIVLDAPLVAKFTIGGKPYIGAKGCNLAFILKKEDFDEAVARAEIVTETVEE